MRAAEELYQTQKAELTLLMETGMRTRDSVDAANVVKFTRGRRSYPFDDVSSQNSLNP
jgi:hypothetical protein